MILIDPIGYFIYGMCVMFYSMMAWFFWRKGSDVLSRLIKAIMLIYVVESLKDLIIYYYVDDMTSRWWAVMTSMDIVIIPFYIFVLMELVKPGWLTWRKGILHEVPFVVLPLLYIITGHTIWYYIIAAWAVFYGSATLVLTFFFISQYHRVLKERFSYEDNINLHWLRAILVSFFFILAAWTCSSVMVDVNFDNLYMILSLATWMFVGYFLYKHESVIDELRDVDDARSSDASGMVGEANSGMSAGDYLLSPEISQMVKDLFENQKIYLDPKLKLSDVAMRVGTNRTYLSRFFNQENGKTFYDYVNNYRVKYAEQLLSSTKDPLSFIAEKAGFNSPSTFRRVFASVYGCSPQEYRRRVSNG